MVIRVGPWWAAVMLFCLVVPHSTARVTLYDDAEYVVDVGSPGTELEFAL